jgi:hypothetical protein
MNKKGWQELVARFCEASELIHDKEQLGSRYWQLKQMYVFINKLRSGATGLGRKEDGTAYASDQWWEQNTKVYAQCFASLN